MHWPSHVYLACALVTCGCTETAALGSRHGPDAQATEEDSEDAGQPANPDRDRFNTPAGIPDAWQRIWGECEISLRGPDLAERPSMPSEHCVATFADADCTYQVEYGPELEDPFALAEGPNYEREALTVDGDPAELTTVLYRLNSDAYLTGLRIPTFRNDPPEYALNASARCATMEALTTARLVLQTVDIPHVGEGLCGPVAPPQKCSIQ